MRDFKAIGMEDCKDFGIEDCKDFGMGDFKAIGMEDFVDPISVPCFTFLNLLQFLVHLPTHYLILFP